MDQKQLKSTLESILFVSNKPLQVKEFAKIIDVESNEIQAALLSLQEDHKNRGIIVLENDGEYQFATNSENSTQVKNFLNAELREKLTDATVEVLAIIAYRQPISKAEIEAIRGVNSQYSIRHLLMRGMIEKSPNPSDARGYQYQTTTEFLQHLGLQSTKDLAEFDKLVEHIKLPETPQAQVETPEPQEIEIPNIPPSEITITTTEEIMVPVSFGTESSEQPPTLEQEEPENTATESEIIIPDELNTTPSEEKEEIIEKDEFDDEDDEDEEE
jgi:segregation and condensation protein B